MILVATFVDFPLDIYQILNDSSLNNCPNKLLENDTFPVYVLMPIIGSNIQKIPDTLISGIFVTEIYGIRDIWSKNLRDTGY